MVRHVILWKLKNTDEDKERVKLGIKEGYPDCGKSMYTR